MLSQWLCVLSVAALSVQGQSGCEPRSSSLFNCCNASDVKINISLEDAKEECAEKYPILKDNGLNTREMEDRRKCIAECIYEKRGLTGDQGVDKMKMKNAVVFSSVWGSVMEDVVDKCVDSLATVTDPSGSRCAGGPLRFTRCLRREVFLNCPEPFWSDNPHCVEMKSLFEKCPEIVLGEEFPF